MTEFISGEIKSATSVEGEENRFLRETAQRLTKLKRIFETQTPGAQGPVQAQFDNLVEQFDALHVAAVQRGFLPLGKSVR